MEECFKALSDRLNWENPEGDLCPFELSKLLPLKGHPGHLTVAVEYIFNNDVEYLKSTYSKRKYTTSITKMKAARYELVGKEDMILKEWSTTKVVYNRDAKCGIKHWGPKRQLFYISQLNSFSKHDVYSHLKIVSVVSLTVNKLNGYCYLEEIMMRRGYRQLYKFKEVIVDLAVALCISAKELYTPSYKPPGVFYEDLYYQKRPIRDDELYKFSDGKFMTLFTTGYSIFELAITKTCREENGQTQIRDDQASW
ncbi:hypothetical protein Tco_0835614 [Tanacetum coccineum]